MHVLKNPDEAQIREAKKLWYHIKSKKNAPDQVWDFGVSWYCKNGTLNTNISIYAHARTPLKGITDYTPNLYEYSYFGFYNWVIYNPNVGVGLVFTIASEKICLVGYHQI